LTIAVAVFILLAVVVLLAVILVIVLPRLQESETYSKNTNGQCSADTESIVNSAQIENANAVFNAELAVRTGEASVCNLINNQGTCTNDSKSLGSHA
jgi:uncharacterized protein YpmS